MVLSHRKLRAKAYRVLGLGVALSLGVARDNAPTKLPSPADAESSGADSPSELDGAQ